MTWWLSRYLSRTGNPANKEVMLAPNHTYSPIQVSICGDCAFRHVETYHLNGDGIRNYNLDSVKEEM